MAGETSASYADKAAEATAAMADAVTVVVAAVAVAVAVIAGTCDCDRNDDGDEVVADEGGVTRRRAGATRTSGGPRSRDPRFLDHDNAGNMAVAR